MDERLIVMSTTLRQEQPDYLRCKFPQFTFKSYGRLEMPPIEELEACEVLFCFGGDSLIRI